MLSEHELEREERRATNMIWNAAGDYSLHPQSRAYDMDGYADVYMNSIVGAVYKYYDYPVIRKLLDGMENAPRGEVYQDLFWTGLENCAYLRAVADRPALRLLRLGYARGILRQAEGKHELDFSLPDRIKLEHYRRALGERHKLIEREERLLEQLEFPPELTSEQIVQRMRDILAEYFGVTTDYLLRGIEPAPAAEARPRANARTMCIIATCLSAAGLILGGGFYFEYQNWICIALILTFDLAAVTVWLLTKGERPRWFWRVNVWPIGALPVWLVSELIAVPVNSALGRFSYELAIRNKQLIDGNGSYTLYSVPPVIIFLLLMFAAWIVVMRLTREKNK